MYDPAIAVSFSKSQFGDDEIQKAIKLHKLDFVDPDKLLKQWSLYVKRACVSEVDAEALIKKGVTDATRFRFVQITWKKETVYTVERA